MEDDTKVCWLIGIFGALLLILVIIDLGFCMPFADEDAVRQCVDAGYGHTFVSYQRTPFSQEALGVRCIKPAEQYVVEGNATILVNKKV